jgi:hypothetical protein
LRYIVPGSFRDLSPEALTPELLAQIKLSVLLGYGFAFSIQGTVGLGSLAAFVIGLVARRRIKSSGGRLAGIGVAWWCIVVGACGAVFWTLMYSETFDGIRNSLRR